MIEDRPFWIAAVLAAAVSAVALEQLVWPVMVTPIGWPLPFAFTIFLLAGSLLGVASLAHYVETRLEIWRRLGLAFLAGAGVMLGAALLWPGLVGDADAADLDFFDEWWLLTLQVGLFLLVLLLVGRLVATWSIRRQAWAIWLGAGAVAVLFGLVAEANEQTAWVEWLRIGSALLVALVCVAAAVHFARRYRERRRRVYRYAVLVLLTSACGAAAHSFFTEPDTIGFYLTLVICGFPYLVMAAGLSGEYRSLLRVRQELARADLVNRVSAAAVEARSEAQLLGSVESELARVGYDFRSSASSPESVGGGAEVTSEGTSDGLPSVVVESAGGLERRVLEALPVMPTAEGNGLVSEELWLSIGRVVGLSLARIEAEESAREFARRVEQANASLHGFAVENAQLLEESSSRMRLLQAMVENTPTLTVLVTAGDWGIVHANQQLRERLGDPARLAGVSITDFFPVIGGSETGAMLANLVEGREPRFFPEVLFEGSSAGAFWCDAHATPLYDPDGRPVHVLLCATDITEAVRLRGSLEAAVGREVRRTEELAAIVRSFPDALLMFDPERHLIFMNPGAAAILRLPDADGGFTAPERTLEDRRFLTVAGEVLEPDELPQARALRDAEGVALEVRMPLADGDEVQLLLCASPVRSPHGEVVGAAMTARDISQMHQIQADLELAVGAERRRSAQLHVLNQVVMGLNSETDSGRMLDEVLVGAARLTGSLGSAFYSREGDRLQLEVFNDLSTARDDCTMPWERREIRDMVGRALAEHRQLRAVTEAPSGARGYLVAPLFGADGEEFGGVALWGPPAAAGFTADDEVFIATLTAHAAVALQNLRRIEHERMIAERLQRAMLPRVPRLAGLDCDLVYESASEAALVGGDFYDLITLSGGRTAVIVGDVCGKGLDAATQTARARYMLRAYAKFDYDPGRWLAEVNGSLADDMAEGDFVTAVLAVVDPVNLTMQYALAGHPPPWIVSAERTLEVDGSPGLPLGVRPSETYTSYAVGLDPGARLLFYSDGLYEARSTDDLFGFDALPAVVAGLVGAPVRGIADRLAAAAREFAGGRLKDDLVVVVLGLTGAQ